MSDEIAQVSNCWCETCRPIKMGKDMRMVLCPECGNKRCPRATDHNNECTNSNEPGQPGNSYPARHVTDALTEEMARLREDAERYRWMRERHENTIMDIYNSISPATISPELLDAAIDAEMDAHIKSLPIQAHSKTEYKRLVTQGANVLPPVMKGRGP